MVSRPDKATSKPLAVAGRCKPMKVEKPKKPRTHKVKQGTPPKLSDSQKRKLVRLYVFTNLSWKEISDLVLHYGRKDIKKRALQYTLQNLLSAQYNQMRPKNTSARRRRASQMQRHLDLRHPRNKACSPFEATSQLAKYPLPQNTRNFVDMSPELNFDTTTATEPLKTMQYPRGNQDYLNEFDRLIEVDQHPQDRDFQLLLNEGLTTSAPLCSVFDQSADELHHPTYQTAQPSSHANSHGLNIDLELSRNVEPDQTNHAILPEACNDNQLAELERDLGWLNGVQVEISQRQENLQGEDFIASDPKSPSILESEYCLTESDERMIIPDGSQEPRVSVKHVDRLSEFMNHTQVLHVSRHSSFSNLSVLVDRCSKCSSGEKRFIKNVIRRFSVSTMSSKTSSSRVRNTSTPSAKSFEDCVSFKAAATSSGNPALLPGDFITSNINTFWEHIECAVFQTSRCDGVIFCSSCCQGQVMPGTKETWCIPFAVIQAKRDGVVGSIWHKQGNPWWVDRFGNTSLHIAAAVGASHGDLREIMNMGVDVHILNSARQTFMHVLDPRLMVSRDLLALIDRLRLNNFKFDHRDVRGHTFLESSELRGVDMSLVPKCWQTLTVHEEVGVPNVGVKVDDHDKLDGETPLMTHVRTVPSQDGIILALIDYGANINARNKKGETALHISIKLGDIVGTKALLAQHATINIHVRDWQGLGLLATAFGRKRHVRDNVGLYARITTCMALAMDAGAIMAPSLFDEWDLREPARDILRKAGYIVAPKEQG
ncbi:MAG: hypothetical protein Q9168_006285 [Polycauliona sp. 1 TL-2023]